ncbi:MAG: AAA family ATPase [Chloroflexi bacterium]|nr:AAA family ATPase [Chloroflexota bacterium]
MELRFDHQITDDLDALIDALPPHLAAPLREREDKHELLEVVLDLGRTPEARFAGREAALSEVEVSETDIEYVVNHIGTFGDDNRAGIERTLHRISCIRNRRGRIVGLTCRVGRAVYGTIRVIEDLVRTGKSILLLGRPGVGKTTMLREVARVLADDLNKRVIIVDTSNEIAGDGDIPHPAIGKARRMQVPTPPLQHALMIEAVENHMPEVIVIDEIGTELEAGAARTIAERGVQLVATAHGNELRNLMVNPTLSDLIGGIQSVTLSDEEARRRRTQKSVLERQSPPTFDVLVEIQSWYRVAIHGDVASTVDAILRGYEEPPEFRELDEDGSVRIVAARELAQERRVLERRGPEPAAPPRRIYPFGVSRRRLEQAVRQTGVPATLAEHLPDADVVITLRNYYRRKLPALREAEARGVPIYVLKANTVPQMEQCLLSLQDAGHSFDPITRALEEAETAALDVAQGAAPVDLTPQNSYIRRLQHELAQRYNVASRSMGREPNRRVRFSRQDGGGAFED